MVTKRGGFQGKRWQTVTRGEGGSKIGIFTVTYFLNGPILFLVTLVTGSNVPHFGYENHYVQYLICILWPETSCPKQSYTDIFDILNIQEISYYDAISKCPLGFRFYRPQVIQELQMANVWLLSLTYDVIYNVICYEISTF